jgi:hypothetical protein
MSRRSSAGINFLEVAGATEYDHVEGGDRQQPVGVRTRYRHSVIRSLWDGIFQ